jgi:hypothetical protein
MGQRRTGELQRGLRAALPTKQNKTSRRTATSFGMMRVPETGRRKAEPADGYEKTKTCRTRGEIAKKRICKS